METNTFMNLIPRLFAGIGMSLMVFMAGCGSAIGLYISGAAVVGAIKKRPESFGAVLALAAMPATQGIYGFVSFFLYSMKVNPQITLFNSSIALGAGILIGVVNWISAVKQGEMVACGINAIGNGHNVFGQTLILGAFIEFYAILSLVTSILMLNNLFK